MRNFKGVIFIWSWRYREIFKSTLVYLQGKWKQTGQAFLFWGNMQKRGDSRTCISMNAWLESCKLDIFANFIYYKFGWWLLLLCAIFFVASTSPAKCYTQPWLCSWLFSEETLWVTCEKLFLEVLNNNTDNNSNNNNNNNNNNKIIIKIYFPHPFLQWLFGL